MFTDGNGNGVERGTVLDGVGTHLHPVGASGGGGGDVERLRVEDSEVSGRFPVVPSLRYRRRRLRGRKSLTGSWCLVTNRDAWTYGAVDPNSGTAALIDIARRYSLMMRLGWNPRRTIYLCSWDAEEFGMGLVFFAAATPQLDDILVEVTKKVTDPDSSGSTLFDKWRTNNEGYPLIERLSDVFSDFSPFLHHAGVPSVDLYYGKAFPVYHTAFDSYDWIVKHGDPLFHRHVAVAGVWGLLALHLADDPILPFNYLSYAAQLQNHTQSLYKLIKGDVSLHPITSAIEELADVAKQVEDEIKRLLGFRWDSRKTMFKHLVYGPASEGKLGFFPGVADAIYESKRQSVIQHEIWRVGRAIQRAASALKGELT
ncbi:putative glutamate carboxypeptidase [Helianthus annuus]|nr:putative glutamate carboxypeptidase [Helianthus annuus]